LINKLECIYLFEKFQLLENNVVVRCRDVDKSLVERLAGGAQAEYKQKTGKECLIKIDENNFLPANGYYS